MHKLQRGAAPACLDRYQHGRDNWGDLSGKDKAEIWQKLEAMQGKRCAYCEIAIIEGHRHIEHFIQKGRDPRVTFQWSNIFGSCNRNESCGRHKDSCGTYNAADLLKTDVDDSDDFLVFVSDGTIVPRVGLDAAQRRRAKETLRVFNLDAQNGALRQMRRSAVAGYIQTAEELWSLRHEFPEDEWQQLLDKELTDTAYLPFVTAIHHTLRRMS